MTTYEIEKVLQKFVTRCKYGISSSDISPAAQEIAAKTDEAMPTGPRFLSPSPLEREWQEHCLKLMFPDYPNACSWQILNSLIINTSKRTELGIPEYDEWLRNRMNSSKKPNNCEEGGKE